MEAINPQTQCTSWVKNLTTLFQWLTIIYIQNVYYCFCQHQIANGLKYSRCTSDYIEASNFQDPLSAILSIIYLLVKFYCVIYSLQCSCVVHTCALWIVLKWATFIGMRGRLLHRDKDFYFITNTKRKISEVVCP